MSTTQWDAALTTPVAEDRDHIQGLVAIEAADGLRLAADHQAEAALDFVRMVHNGIDGLTAAYAERLNILHRANAGTEQRAGDPRPRRFPIASTATRSTWPRSRRSGVVARCRLLAARPDRRRARRLAGSLRVQRPGLRLRRVSLDRSRRR